MCIQFNTWVSQCELNYWNKWIFPWHSNLLRCTYIYIYIYIYIIVVNVNNALMQIHFNGTNFINVRLTQRVFSVWPVAQPVVGEMEMHSVANLAKFLTPLPTFSLQKSFQTLFNLWELPSTAARAWGLAFTVCTHTSLFLARSLRRLSLCSTGGSRQRRAAL